MTVGYLKATNRCAVGCTHCYLPEEVRASKERMSWKTLGDAADLLSKAREARGGQLLVIWHGGEPMSLRPEWYREADDLLDGRMGPGWLESMQTSLMQYTGEWAGFLRERCGGEVGSSVDFTTRALKGSTKAYQDFWMAKADAARQDGILVIPGMVPSKEDAAKPSWVMDWFAERNFPVFNVERYNQFGQKLPGCPTNLEHSGFLRGLTEEVERRIENGKPAPFVKTLAAAITGVLYGEPGDRWGGNCMSDFIVVEPNGDVNNCPDKASFEAPLSNAAEGWRGLSASEGRRKWIRLQAAGHRIDECSSCENAPWCKSGCPITPNASRSSEQGDCSGYKGYLTWLKDRMRDAGRRELFEKYARKELLHSSWLPRGEMRGDVAEVPA